MAREMHEPVLSDEVLHYLKPVPGGRYIDATADGGGHAVRIIQAIAPDGKLLAIEWDEELFKHLGQRLKKECSPFSKNYVLRRTSYSELGRIVRSLRFGPVKGVLFDLGLSSFHLEASRRGFSFQRDEPLDMRYSRTDLAESAADMLAQRSRRELEHMLKDFGEERFSRAIAERIVAERRRQPIQRTGELVRIIRQATPSWYHRLRIHFATRTFQALRIAVNREFEHIPEGLAAAAHALAPQGRIVTIAFHYREDALIKRFFRQPTIRPRFSSVVDPPLRPSAIERTRNPRARSALLRVFEKQL